MIKVKNWDRYQSYKDRKPPWIRLHRDLLDDYDFQIMSADARALLPMLWLLACENEDPRSGLISYSFEKIAFRLRLNLDKLRTTISELQSFEFIECADSVPIPLRNRSQTVPSETETETETENPLVETQQKPPVDKIPYQQIVDTYHAELPMCPRVRELTEKRKGYIRARWKSGALPDLETWQKYFCFCRQSGFLTGQADPAPGRQRFVATLEWLTTESNYVKVIERKYHG